MSVAKLIIEKLRRANAQVALKDGNLEIISRDNQLNEALISELRANKPAIIDYLKKRAGQSRKTAAINPAPLSSKYPLSSSQRRLWMLSQLSTDNSIYNIPRVHVFKNSLNQEALVHALKALVARHESLRTVFTEEDGEVYQVVQPLASHHYTLHHEDLRGHEDKEALVQNLVEKDFTTSFDLSKGPLLRVNLYQIDDDRWVFTYVMHHIISDGWSMQVMLKELLHFYKSYQSNVGQGLASLKIHYKDFAVWQQEQLGEPSADRHKAYWLKQFEGELPVLELPNDLPRPVTKTYQGGVVTIPFSTEVANGVSQLCKESGSTPYNVLLAGVYALFNRYTGQEDMVLGTPIAGREHAELENQIGFFVNTLALRCRFDEKASFLNLLQEVKKITKEAHQHQSYPFDELVSTLPLHRDNSRNPLFDVMVTLKKEDDGLVDDTLVMEKVSLSGHSQICIFDLTVTFIETAKGITLELGYNSDIYSHTLAQQIGAHYHQLMQAITKAPSQAIASLDYLTEEEKGVLISEFNPPVMDVTECMTLVDRFVTQANQTPNAVAITSGDIRLTYQQLDEKSNQLANYLKETYQVQEDSLIGVSLPRNEWLVISILAVLKSGGGYVPIDPDYPQERIDYLLEDAQCKVLIDEGELETFFGQAEGYSPERPSVTLNPHSLAYIIYTSGSTGKPKGVMVTHQNLALFIANCKEKYATAVPPVMPFIASSSFDISLFQLFYPLSAGGEVMILPKPIINDINQLVGKLQEVSAIDTVPALMEQVLLAISSAGTASAYYKVKDLFIGGDLIPDEILSKMRAVFPQANIHVTYGPTESTVFVTGRSYGTAMALPFKGTLIGKPNKNANIFILDTNQQLVPIGVTGEIYIGGPSVAKGYLNQEVLSKERFIVNPAISGQRLYKTGDLAKRLPDGTIVYKGRGDNQVKVRGFRIELGEIENVARNDGHVEQVMALVTTSEDGQKGLNLYVVYQGELDEAHFRAYLGRSLPVYMVPDKIIQLAQMPLTPNGKIDRNALLQLKGTQTSKSSNYLPPRNELEEQLVLIWQELLERDQVGIDDNFFEVGGNSIKIIKLSKEVSKVFNKEISIAQLFEYTTISQLVEFMEAGDLVVSGDDEEEFDREGLLNDLDKFI